MIMNLGQGGSAKAEKTEYDNTTSGLTSDNVQGAIDELKTSIGKAESNINTLDTNLNVKVSSFNSSTGVLALVSV